MVGYTEERTTLHGVSVPGIPSTTPASTVWKAALSVSMCDDTQGHTRPQQPLSSGGTSLFVGSKKCDEARSRYVAEDAIIELINHAP